MGELTQFDNVSGYLARPAEEGPAPAVIVIQEWWGLNDQIKSVADRFAAAGYLAFAPDLFHGELAELGENEKAAELVQKYAPTALGELQKVYEALTRYPNATGRVGSLGFCFGGYMSLSLGITRPLNAVCTFYGGGMQQLFDRLGELKAPVLGLFGDRDQSIPAGTVEEFIRLLEQFGIQHEVIVYPNSGHAFFRDGDPAAYKPEAAKDAWERVSRFFGRNLYLA